jgi:hypothetical protein
MTSRQYLYHPLALPTSELQGVPAEMVRRSTNYPGTLLLVVFRLTG